jgi:hypothetical protein
MNTDNILVYKAVNADGYNVYTNDEDTFVYSIGNDLSKLHHAFNHMPEGFTRRQILYTVPADMDSFHIQQEVTPMTNALQEKKIDIILAANCFEFTDCNCSSMCLSDVERAMLDLRGFNIPSGTGIHLPYVMEHIKQLKLQPSVLKYSIKYLRFMNAGGLDYNTNCYYGCDASLTRSLLSRYTVVCMGATNKHELDFEKQRINEFLNPPAAPDLPATPTPKGWFL